ncbi:hypothetical protein AGR6A_pAt60146 [Agrobacterium sp. NCPPB 925]|nr:hypothetical protein AGR6A_pAt60146 [Agrobacterium sp. NCPPB 925]
MTHRRRNVCAAGIRMASIADVFFALNQIEPPAANSATRSLKIPARHLQRIDMKIGHEHIPRDNGLRPVSRILTAAAVGELIPSPSRQLEVRLPISQTN